MIYIIGFTVIFLDQVFKGLILRYFEPGSSYPVFENIFHLTFVKNTGAAFGVFPSNNNILIILSLLIIIIFLVYINSISYEGLFLKIGAGFILGGAGGNLVDRIYVGYVIDYLDFRIWPVFNFADAAIVCGVGLLIIWLWNSKELER